MKSSKKIRYTKVSSIYIKDMKPISTVLNKSLKEFSPQLDKRLNQRLITKFWENMFGLSIVNATQKITIHKKTISIQLSSSVIKSELLMLKDAILEKFQEKFGKENVQYLIIY